MATSSGRFAALRGRARAVLAALGLLESARAARGLARALALRAHPANIAHDRRQHATLAAFARRTGKGGG